MLQETQTERLLCRIWSQVLGVNRIGIDDDFFAIGGHSLLAAKLFARLDEAFGRSLPLGVLFTASTIRSLAERYRSTIEPTAALGNRPAQDRRLFTADLCRTRRIWKRDRLRRLGA